MGLAPSQVRAWPAADVRRMAGFLTLQNQRQAARARREQGTRRTRRHW